MDFNYTPEQETYRNQVRAWLEANQPPPLTEEEKERANEDFLWERGKQWHKKLYAAGWVGLSWPKEYGGRGATFIEQVIYHQELARLGLSTGINVLGIIMTGPALMQWGNDEQKKRYLQPIIGADEIWCEGMSEPGAGSDLAALQTRAELQGDYFVVNGQKVWTTHAHRADFCQLFVRTDPAAPKHKGLSCLLVDMKAPGVAVKPLKQISGDSEFNEIFFEDVRVPKENLLGPLNAGWQVLVSTLMHERFGINEISAAEVILAQLVELAKIVPLNGHTAAEDDEIRQKIAESESSIGKLVSTELSQRMVKFASRLLGPYTYMERRSPFAPDGDWLRRTLQSESFTIAGGTSSVQKNMIGERILQLPKG